MKRIFITLFSAVIIFILTLLITNHYVTEKAIAATDYENCDNIDDFCTDLDSDLKMSEQAVYSFLTGNFNINKSDSTGCLVASDKDLDFFYKYVYDSLDDFLRVNPYYKGAMFIIDSDIYEIYKRRQSSTDSTKRCFAPGMKQNDSTHYDFAENYDFMNAANYNKLKKEKKAFWTLPSKTSVVHGKIVTLYIPIVGIRGRFFGAFALSIDLKTIDEKLKKHLPYSEHDSEITLVDEKGEIISSYPYNYRVEESIEKLEAKNIAHGKKYLDRGYSDHKTFIFDDVIYFQYERSLTHAPWKLYTVCSESAIYKSVNDTKSVVLTTSLIGMLLMLISCVVVFRQTRKNMRQKAAAEEELKMAAKVQMGIIKKAEFKKDNTVLDAFIKPAKEAGGDLYDYAWKDGKLIFCIGDVSGKGMAAALFMTQVVSLFRNAIRYSADPRKIVSDINDVLAQNNPDMTFCTFFVGVLENNTLNFCNAGHNPLVLMPQRSFIKCIPNTAVGLMEGFPYRAETLQLSSGDSLFLYTDGVTEAKNKSHKCFDDSRLLEALSPSNTQKHGGAIPSVISAVEEFSKGCQQSDDITMLYVEVL